MSVQILHNNRLLLMRCLYGTHSLAFRCGHGVSKQNIIQKTFFFFSEVPLCLSTDCTLDALSTCD